MRKLTLTLIIAFGLIPETFVFGQTISFPEWIQGTWNNSYESNTNNFIFWTFLNDSIIIDRGLLLKKSDREILNEKYSGYKTTNESNDSTYRINFFKGNENIIYEFKRQKVSYSDKSVLTYSLTINGVVKRDHSTGCNWVFTR